MEGFTVCIVGKYGREDFWEPKLLWKTVSQEKTYIIIYGTKIAVFIEIYLEDPLNITKLHASELPTFWKQAFL